ncbi:hypothetical protein [Aquimarina muelleri]|uniref:Aromatic ring-opening dioxygenase LigA n=1 Tax=Aquimarina muelleri TaxID=279356 RepID=A0A918JZ38_9FLAO|nr:hypothetical protein [Aquimarina muelleri]MCX2763686.1 hypothetical protein [Aquimarina muelleri]GGX30331.1 hypothetical protein GCM10007384_34310 [Aquimarina muelleri]
MNEIKLNFINQSADTNNSNVVIFQKNVAEDFEEIAIAWKVIQNCGRSDNHPFNYPMNFGVSASDSYVQLTASNGEVFDMIKSTSGNILQRSSFPATNANQIEVRNRLVEEEPIKVNLYKDGKLFAVKNSLFSGQKAVFEFPPKIYIGVISELIEGDVINSAIISQVKSQINLFGITSADIVMTGGPRPGGNSFPFNFTLENINK